MVKTQNTETMRIIPDLPQAANEAVRQEQVQKQQSEYHLIGTVRKVRGHTLFEFNRKTKNIRPAELDRKVVISYNPKANTNKEVYKEETKVNKDCFYLQALNKANAEKKLRKLRLL